MNSKHMTQWRRKQMRVHALGIRKATGWARSFYLESAVFYRDLSLGKTPPALPATPFHS